ncbi:MAG: dicarboxylate/amino acid:cation symporter [Vampirovibrionales bacterium]|nr:dicarboxylate/amino acid:cation symporter [Vampirovibrionales bacterium]
MRAFWLFLVAFGLGAKRHWHILFAIILGVIAGIAFPIHGADGTNNYTLVHNILDSFGQVFIRLITMIVIPLVMSSLVVGISSLGDSKQLGRMGLKVLTYFLIFMGISALLGGGLAYVLEPGHYLQDSIQNQAELVSQYHQNSAQEQIQQLKAETPELKTLFFNMIPENPFEALANADLIPVIVFTIIFGIAIASIGEAGRPIVGFFEALFTATMRLTDWLMVLAVPGVFSLAFITVANTGIEVFGLLYTYIAALLLGLLAQVALVFPLFLRTIAKVNVMNLYRAVSEATMVAFGTASSSATLPITIACCERRAGISNRIASFVLPTGATINKTGTTLFEVVAVLFLCQAYGIQLEVYHWVVIMIFSIVASIGAAGIPSTGLITMAIVFKSLGSQFDLKTFSAGIAMLWSIDRVLDMCRTVVNVLSSCTVATLVAASEGELNRDILNNQDKWSDVVS